MRRTVGLNRSSEKSALDAATRTSIGEQDERTKARVEHYVTMLGGTVLERDGQAIATELPDWPAVVDLATLLALDAAEYSPTVVRLARELRTVANVLAWVQAYVEWRDEPGERLQYPTETLALGGADCDCHAILVCSLVTALGYPSAVVGLTLDGEPRHAAAAVELARGHGSTGWFWADSTEPGNLRPWQRHPMAADAREGVRGVILPRLSAVPAWP